MNEEIVDQAASLDPSATTTMAELASSEREGPEPVGVGDTIDDQPPSITIPDAEATADAASDDEGETSKARRIVVANSNFPGDLGDQLELIRGTDGHAYLRRVGQPHLPVLRVGSKASNAYLRGVAHARQKYPTARDLRDINDHLIALAESLSETRDVYYRVAPVPGGVEIDLGNRDHTRVRVTAGRVEVRADGSDTLFYRTATMQALPTPAESGDVRRLSRFLNISGLDRCLLIAWLSYTLGHPKLAMNTFIILVLFGDQGTGKSFLARLILALVDPNSLGLQTFPRDERDLAIAAAQAHVLCYDNLRQIKPLMADRLCAAASGANFSTRRLYSDDDQVILRLHVALVLNGIHAFADQPDLAQRCLFLTMRSLEEMERRDEATMASEFEAELPCIFRGLLDLMANIFANLPSAEIMHPERVIAFCRWLSAMEQADGVPSGSYQEAYSIALKNGMLESLLEDPVAAAILNLVDGERVKEWSGTPEELYATLDATVTRRTQWSREWPANEIGLGKRLKSLTAAFKRQGVDVRKHRGRERRYTITRVEVSDD